MHSCLMVQVMSKKIVTGLVLVIFEKLTTQAMLCISTEVVAQ